MTLAESAPVPVAAVPEYDQDFFLWTQYTAALLREGRFGDLDVAHLAEEIEDMGKRDRREVESRLELLLIHLLKWHGQADRRSDSWRRTIATQRAELERALRDSPSLRRWAEGDIGRHYTAAVRRAAQETRLPAAHFPPTCPWGLAQLLDETIVPE